MFVRYTYDTCEYNKHHIQTNNQLTMYEILWLNPGVCSMVVYFLVCMYVCMKYLESSGEEEKSEERGGMNE